MTEEYSKYKVDLACGDNKREGFIGIDKFKTPSVDIVHDLLTYPWPFPDEYVDEAHSSHFFEHIPGMERPKFIEELYRVLKPKAQCTFIVPDGNSNRMYQDFTHQWPPVVPEAFLYYNRAWREANKLTHGYYDLKCDFDFTYGYQVGGSWAIRNEEARNFALIHYRNVATDIIITLIKR